MRIIKYIFNSKEQAEEKIKRLGVYIDENGNEYKNHKHIIVKLGYEIIEDGEIDEDNNVIKETVFSDRYLIDVLWYNLEEQPYGWKSYEVIPSGEPIHGFYGVDYLRNII